jgi:hypothetical protein
MEKQRIPEGWTPPVPLTPEPVTCEDIWRLLGQPPNCCPSCHEDYDDWGTCMCGLDLPDSAAAQVCCTTAIAWHKNERQASITVTMPLDPDSPNTRIALGENPDAAG